MREVLPATSVLSVAAHACACAADAARGQDRAETLSTVAVLELLAGLLDFTTQCYADRLDNVNGVLSSAVTALTAQLSKCVVLYAGVCAC